MLNNLDDKHYNKILCDMLIGMIEYNHGDHQVSEIIDGIKEKNHYHHFLKLKLLNGELVQDLILDDDFLNLSITNFCILCKYLDTEQSVYSVYINKNTIYQDEEEDYPDANKEKTYVVTTYIKIPVSVVVKAKTDDYGETNEDILENELLKNMTVKEFDQLVNNNKLFIDFNSYEIDDENILYQYADLTEVLQDEELREENYPKCLSGIIQEELLRRQETNRKN